MALGWVLGCSGGARSPIPFTSGQPFGDEDDDGGEETEGAATGIDLDGGGPPPPGEDSGLPPADNHGDCCEGNGSPGCDNKAVELCVCASDEWCCDSEWDDACAALIEPLGCGHCNDPDDGGEPPPPPPGGDDGSAGGDCCSEHAGPGCDDPLVEACVCDVEPACCDAHWGAGCTAVLEVYGCGECGAETGEPPPGGETGGEPPPGGETGGEAPPEGGGGSCCADNGSPGCDDAVVEACVCMSDSYCCDTEWDGVCVDEVDTLGCGTCGGGEGGSGGEISECCAQQPGAGCPDAPVETCVCMVDDYCCSVAWDLTCAGEVESLGCGSCS